MGFYEVGQKGGTPVGERERIILRNLVTYIDWVEIYVKKVYFQVKEDKRHWMFFSETS